MKLERIKQCMFCTKDFKANSDRRIFCSDMCKTRSFRASLDCFYCGEIADSRDHITPHSTTGGSVRRWSTDTVRCCRECNSYLGDHFPNNFKERCFLLHDIFKRKKKLNKPFIQWDEDELDEVKGSLRQFIIDSQKARLNNERRLSHIYLTALKVQRFDEYEEDE